MNTYIHLVKGIVSINSINLYFFLYHFFFKFGHRGRIYHSVGFFIFIQNGKTSKKCLAKSLVKQGMDQSVTNLSSSESLNRHSLALGTMQHQFQKIFLVQYLMSFVLAWHET